MPSERVQVNVRLQPADIERLRALQRRLEARYGPHVKVSVRMVVLEALDALEGYYDRLEKDKGRRR